MSIKKQVKLNVNELGIILKNYYGYEDVDIVSADVADVSIQNHPIHMEVGWGGILNIYMLVKEKRMLQMDAAKIVGSLAIFCSLASVAIVELVGQLAITLDTISGTVPCLHHCIAGTQVGYVDPNELRMLEFSRQLGMPFNLFVNIFLTSTIGLFFIGVALLILGFTRND